MANADEQIVDRLLAETSGIPVRRPDPLRWLWYAVGGRLPRRHSGWVLRDLTCRTWVVRHLLRALVQVAPVAVVLLLVIPGAWSIRAAAVLAGLLLGLLYSGAYAYEISEHRARKAGFPAGSARLLRERANADERRAEAERYAHTWRRPADEGGPPSGTHAAGGADSGHHN